MDVESGSLLTIRETAERLGCSEANVYALIEGGELPYVRIGRRKGYRIDPADLAGFIAGRKEQREPARPRLHRPRLKHLKL